jgi:glycosyltransferase involved in cell wall biosynthesis
MSGVAAPPLVSVVTPFLDAERFLEAAIESVRQQTHPSWELLLVDDGGGDGSPAIARRAAEGDPERVRVLQHPGRANRGPAASRDLALAEARGEYVAFLDADDLFLPFKLERQVAELERHREAGMLTAGALFWHSPALPPDRRLVDFVPPPPLPPGRVHPPPALLTAIVRDENVHPAPVSVLLRRELCERIGGFGTPLRMYEDTVLLAKASLAAPVLVSGDCSGVYRIHPDSACHRAEREGTYALQAPNEARRAFLEWLDEHLTATGSGDDALRRALARALRPYRHPGRERALGALAAPGRIARGFARRVLRR